MSRKPHICFVAPALYPLMSGAEHIEVIGGAEVQQYHLTRAFVEKGYRISVISMDYGQPEASLLHGAVFFKTFKPEEGLPVLRFVHPRLSNTWRALKKAGADIYYTRTASVLAGFTALFCKVYSARMIYAGAHDTDFIPGKQIIRYWRDKKIFEYGLRHADAIVVQNSTQAELCSKHYIKTPEIIPSMYLPLPSEAVDKDIDILWVGTVKEWKRPGHILAIARALPHRRISMVGGPGVEPEDTPYFERIRQEASNIRNLEFHGFVPFNKVERYFDRARLFVSTSETEGMPNTFLQAWARRVPTVSFFEPRVPGDLTFPGIVVADVESAVRVIDDLLSEEEKIGALGKHCERYYSTQHSGQATIDAYESLFRRLSSN